MGIDPSSLNERQRKLIEPAQRQALGLEVSRAMHERKLRRFEKDEQLVVVNWLTLREEDSVLCFDWSRTDRKTTNRKGMPDFRIYKHGRALLGEMKVGEGKLSPEQIEMMEKFSRSGTEVQIWRSAAEAIEKIRGWCSEL